MGSPTTASLVTLTLVEIRQALLNAGMLIQDQLDDVKTGSLWKFQGLREHPFVYTHVSHLKQVPSPRSITIGIAEHPPFKDGSGPILVTQVEFEFDIRSESLNVLQVKFYEGPNGPLWESVIFRLAARAWLEKNILKPLIYEAQANS